MKTKRKSSFLLMSVNVIVKFAGIKEIIKINNVPATYSVEQFRKNIVKLCELNSDISKFRFIVKGQFLDMESKIGDLEVDESSTVTIFAAGAKPKSAILPPKPKIEPKEEGPVAEQKEEEPEIHKPAARASPYIRHRVDPKSFIVEEQSTYKQDMQDFRHKARVETPFDRASQFLMQFIIGSIILMSFAVLFYIRYQEMKLTKSSKPTKFSPLLSPLLLLLSIAFIGYFIIRPLYTINFSFSLLIECFGEFIKSFIPNRDLEKYKELKYTKTD